MKKLLSLALAFVALVAFAAVPSRQAVAVATTSTVIFSQVVNSQANKISVAIQNPVTNSDSIEVAWDDVDNPMVAGTGQVLGPGDWRVIQGLPVNANMKVGLVGISLGAGPVTVRVQVSSTP